MDTSEFESKFLGQPAIVSIDEKGTLVSIQLKYFPIMKIELSEEYKKELEIEYEAEILEVLRENYRDAQEQKDHTRLESDKGKFI